MKTGRTIAPQDVLAAAGTATLASIVSWILLCVLATPHDFSERTAALSNRAAAARKLIAATPADGSIDAVCQRTVGAEVDAQKRALAALATQSGFQLAGVEVAAEGANSGGRSALAAVRLEFAGSGSYEAAMQMLDALSRSRPQVFVDTLDLTSKTSSVDLKFSGRVFCAARS